MTTDNTKQVKFQEMGLIDPLLKAIEGMGFENPTPIQAQAIPYAIGEHDLMGCAGTGTGKTAAFAIPLLQKLMKDSTKSALVVAPTRELASQIKVVFDQLLKFQNRSNLRAALLVGGEPIDKQKRVLRGNPRLIVGTPGRIIDHLMSRRFQPRFFSTLVLDEADRMLDMGFEPQLKQIVSTLPKERQSLMFSATFPEKIKKLAQAYLSDPVSVDVRERRLEKGVQPNIKQVLQLVDGKKKKESLLDSINERPGSMIIFVGTRRRTDYVAQYLSDYDLPVGLIHGDRSQSQRNRAIRDFRSGKTRILVATDVAARGIDVPHVENVINFDLPQVAEDYLHRIGRTGRAGMKGEALTLVTSSDRRMWNEIERFLKKNGSPSPEFERNSRERFSSERPDPRQRKNRKRRPRSHKFPRRSAKRMLA